MSALETASRYRWVILALAFVAQMSNALIAASVPPLAPLFQAELGLSKAEVGLFSSAAFAGTWGVLIVTGPLTDRLGVRKMMSVGMLASGAVLLAMSTVGGFLQAIAVMFATGIGRGMTSPGITKSVMDWFPPRTRATVMGLKQAGVPFAGIVTGSTLPALGLAVGWRSSIAVVGFLILLSGVATAFLYRDPCFSRQAGPRRASMRAGVREVLCSRALWIVSLIAILYVSVQLGLTTYLALYLNEVVLVPVITDEHTRFVVSGGYLAICQAGGVFGRVFWGVVSDRVFHGRRMAVMAIVGVLAANFSWAIGSLSPAVPLWLLTVVVFGCGATAIGWNALVQAVIVEAAGKKYAGTGVGVSMTLSQIGTVGGAPLFGFVVDVTGSYPTAWLLMGGFCLGGAALSILGARGEKCIE